MALLAAINLGRTSYGPVFGKVTPTNCGFLSGFL